MASVHCISTNIPRLAILKFTYIENSASHRHFLGSKTLCEDIEQHKIWVSNRIYQRMNETVFVSKSFIWRWFAMITIHLGWLFSFEIEQLSSQIPLFSLDNIGQSEVPSQKITEIFSFTHVCARYCRVCAGSNWVNQFEIICYTIDIMSLVLNFF